MIQYGNCQKASKQRLGPNLSLDRPSLPFLLLPPTSPVLPLPPAWQQLPLPTAAAAGFPGPQLQWQRCQSHWWPSCKPTAREPPVTACKAACAICNYVRHPQHSMRDVGHTCWPYKCPNMQPGLGCVQVMPLYHSICTPPCARNRNPTVHSSLHAFTSHARPTPQAATVSQPTRT